MEGISTGESFPRIDFLDENLEIKIVFESEAYRNLPVITEQDRELERERFGVLLGSVSVDVNGRVLVTVKGVYQEDEREQRRYQRYVEGTREVSYDLAAIKERIRQVNRIHPEFRDFVFLGDVHTHPNSISYPSMRDLISGITAHESGDIRQNELYVFGIGSIREDGQMDYEYFRMVRTDSGTGYGFKELD